MPERDLLVSERRVAREIVQQINVEQTTVPAGSVIMWAGGAAPTGWLLCDGSAVSRTTYAGLFAEIGTTFGVGDGSTTFNLPQLEQRFPLGFKDGTNNVGDSGGSFNHTHTGPNHGHPFSDSFTTSGHTWNAVGNNDGIQTRVIGTGGHSGSVSGTTSNAGTGATGSNNPPYLVLAFIIKDGS